MTWVLLTGVALNWVGALRLGGGAYAGRRLEPRRADALLYQWFAAGTAAVFGAMYLYLYVEPAYAVPFLAFGAALKTWAFAVSAGLLATGLLSRSVFFEFGVSNGVVGALFWIYLATES